MTMQPLLATMMAVAVALPALRAELLEMRDVDQEAMLAVPFDKARLDAVLAANTSRLKEIVAEHGWPGASLVGREGASAAWLIAQHADADKAFQREVLALITPLVETGEVRGVDYAYLWDRLHEPQRYGTQGRCVDGAFVLREVEDPGTLDERRAGRGMGPVRDYIELASAGLCNR